MKPCTIENQTEVRITAENLEAASLSGWERLELHLLDQAAVVIPGHMTVMELIRVTEALQGLASDLLSVLVDACDHCDNCQMDEPCELMTGPVLPKVSIPGYGWRRPDLTRPASWFAQLSRGEVKCESQRQSAALI